MQFKQMLGAARTVAVHPGLLRRYSFAAGAVGLILVMALLVVGKDVVGLFAAHSGGGGQTFAAQSGGGQAGEKQGRNGAQSQNQGRAGAGQGGGGNGGALAVDVAQVGTHEFSDSVRALGTAQARESISIVSKVTDTIRAIKFESGDRVKTGQILVEMANIQQTAALNQALAQLDVDNSAYERSKELFDKGFNSKATLDVADAKRKSSQAQVEVLRSTLADRTIRAPFNGVVGLRTASPGMLATPGTQIGTLDDTSVIKLDFDVSESELTKMKKGVPLIAKTSAYPDREFSGQIDEVDSRVNPTTRTVRVRALLPNPTGVLRPGMLMTVDVHAGQSTSLSAPEIAVSEQGDLVSVYRVASNGGGPPRAEQVNITAGRRQDGQVEVLSGLRAGDTIITSGVVQLRTGQVVRINNAGGATGGGGEQGAAGARQRGAGALRGGARRQ
jgi:membrane fusion protein, multidrug efflux system